MPTNKHASFRYRVLNQCFTNRGHRRWTLEELVDEVSRFLEAEFGSGKTVGRRTIQGDLNVMRSPRPRGFAAPIVCRNGTYYYADPDYSIERVVMADSEVEVLREAVALLSQVPALPQLPALELLLQRLSGSDGLSASVIQFEANPAVHGLSWLQQLYESILKRRVLSVRYHPFEQAPQDILIHPYLLKEWRNRWFIFGRNSDNQLWNLALDRIRDITPLPEAEYLPNDLFDPATWFEDIVGVTKPEGATPEVVEIAVSGIFSHYIETKPIHHSQRLLQRKDGIAVFALRVIPNPELVSELMPFGKHLEVRRPESLRRMLAERT